MIPDIGIRFVLSFSLPDRFRNIKVFDCVHWTNPTFLFEEPCNDFWFFVVLSVADRPGFVNRNVRKSVQNFESCTHIETIWKIRSQKEGMEEREIR